MKISTDKKSYTLKRNPKLVVKKYCEKYSERLAMIEVDTFTKDPKAIIDAILDDIVYTYLKPDEKCCLLAHIGFIYGHMLNDKETVQSIANMIKEVIKKKNASFTSPIFRLSERNT